MNAKVLDCTSVFDSLEGMENSLPPFVWETYLEEEVDSAEDVIIKGELREIEETDAAPIKKLIAASYDKFIEYTVTSHIILMENLGKQWCVPSSQCASNILLPPETIRIQDRIHACTTRDNKKIYS